MNQTLSIGGFAELTAANYGSFKNQICAVLLEQSSLEIDLSRTTSMDCAGLGALISLGKIARGRNSAMRLVNPTPRVQKLFEVVHAGQYFDIVSTLPTDGARHQGGTACSISSLSNRPSTLCQSAA